MIEPQLETQLERQRRYRRERIAAGLCRDCKEAAVPGRRQCAKHLERSALQQAERRRRMGTQPEVKNAT